MSDTPQVPKVNFLELVKSGSHYTERRGDRIHIVDAKTGETFSMYSSNLTGVPEEMELVVLEDGTKVWTQPALVPTLKNSGDVIYSPITVDLICQKIIEGQGLTEICGQHPFPTYVTFTRWRRENPAIEVQLERARADRAEGLRDKIMREARDAVSTKDPINASNLKIETMKWAAGIDNPGVYSPKARVEATINMPTQIVVHTGISREPELPRGQPIDVTPTLEKKDD